MVSVRAVCKTVVLCCVCAAGAAVRLTGQEPGVDGLLKSGVIAAIEKNYFRDVNVSDLEKMSLSEILKILDKDSSWINPAPEELDFYRGFKRKSAVGDSRLVPPSVAYISLKYFGGATANEFRKSLARLKGQGAGKLVLDLRGNDGGDFQSAISIARLFVPRGEAIATVESKAGTSVYRSDNSSPDRMPMVVLVDSRTASSAELLALAMRESRQARVVGVETEGKSTVQQMFPIRSQWLSLTVGHWTSGGGRSAPVVPDVAVADPEQQMRKGMELLQN